MDAERLFKSPQYARRCSERVIFAG
jgi:hypothetical protein